MEQVLEYLELVVDKRQEKKVQHKMSDIIALVFFAVLSNADDWVEIETFGEEHEEFLRQYIWNCRTGYPRTIRCSACL